MYVPYRIGSSQIVKPDILFLLEMIKLASFLPPFLPPFFCAFQLDHTGTILAYLSDVVRPSLSNALKLLRKSKDSS